LWNGDEGNYTLVLSHIDDDDRVQKYLIEEVEGGSYPRQGDSIWIDHSLLMPVSDESGNPQRRRANRRAVLSVKEKPFVITTRTANNPFTPSASKVPASIASLPEIRKELKGNRYTTGDRVSGTVIMAEVTFPGKASRRTPDLKGTISLYDIVDNPILERRPMAFDRTNTKWLYYVWDGRNRDGRYVAGGTYLAVIEITDGGEVKERTVTRIGVKR
jgi:hypothetical protein